MIFLTASSFSLVPTSPCTLFFTTISSTFSSFLRTIFFLLCFNSPYCFQIHSNSSFINHSNTYFTQARLLTTYLNKPQIKTVHHSSFSFPFPSFSSLFMLLLSIVFRNFPPVFVPITGPLAAHTKSRSLCYVVTCSTYSLKRMSLLMTAQCFTLAQPY
jgi:hypothetical protein